MRNSHAIFVNSTQQKIGPRALMLQEAKALGKGPKSGSVTVWKLDDEGKRIGKPIYRSHDGKVLIKP